ncbi:hypothetical protein NDU88_003363 [Pleurodeles waltl]|uniref:Reverse transcriptase domain-containing protein n=1 Tax=Pleurodeles waltl TaxID=8319 RepID=A0AAV7L3R0_PLEWA|nr:hypothetical protein NDU88_003363 [Pleurodeles waltl]
MRPPVVLSKARVNGCSGAPFQELIAGSQYNAPRRCSGPSSASCCPTDIRLRLIADTTRRGLWHGGRTHLIFEPAPLQPIVKRIPTYLKDTTHVLLLLESIAFDKSKELLITLDVESLYTNIPQEATLEVISNLLDVHMGVSQTQTPPGFILDLAHLALTRNYFKFEDSFFLQTQGTSMGSTFAPSLACLYVDHIERHTILHEDNPYRDQIKLWKRYIDDVLLIWTGSKEEAQAFAIWLNGANPFLTFTMNIGLSWLCRLPDIPDSTYMVLITTLLEFFDA